MVMLASWCAVFWYPESTQNKSVVSGLISVELFRERALTGRREGS